MLQHLPVKDDDKGSASNRLATVLREGADKKSSKAKIEEIREIVPEDFLNGFSSVNLREKKNKMASK